MQTIATTTASALGRTDVRVAERSRGTAHPAAPSTRDLVARSLLLRPEARAERYVRRG